jgi:hypothetical protein
LNELFAGTTWLQLSVRAFAIVNVVAILLWLAATWRVIVWRRRLCAAVRELPALAQM